MAHISAELTAVEFEPFEPARLAGLLRGGLAEGAQGRLAVVGMGGPAFAVDPRAVELVPGRSLAQLRDHEPVHVRAESGGLAGVGLAIGGDAGPFGVAAHGLAVPDSREMDEERDAPPGSFGAPDGERIADNAGRGGADFGRPAEPSGMAFGIVLDEVRAHPVEQPSNGFRRDIAAELRVLLVGVQIEVQAEVAVCAAEAAGGGLRGECRCWQRGGEAAAGEVCQRHRRYNIGF